MSEAEPTSAVDRPAYVEHHRRDEGQLQPAVGEDPDRDEAAGHDREQHRRGEEHPQRHPAREVPDLRASLGHLLVFRRLAWWFRSNGLRARALDFDRGWMCAVAVDLRLDDQLAVNHVHTAGESKLTRTVRHELDGRTRV